jgi:hypothetical protein
MQYRTNTYIVYLGVFSIVFGQVQQDKIIPVQLIVKVQNVSIESTPEFYKTELMDAAFKQAADLVKFDVSSKNCILKSVTLIDSGPQEAYISPTTDNSQPATEKETNA